MLKVCRQRLGQKEAQVARGSTCSLSQLNVANQVGSCDRVQEWAFDASTLAMILNGLLRTGPSGKNQDLFLIPQPSQYIRDQI